MTALRRTVLSACLAALAALAAVATAAPGSAIIGPSTPDASHPQVGVLLPTGAMPVPRLCGATPISPRVLVLAGHCAALRLMNFGDSRGVVTFDPDVRDDIAGFGPGWTYAGAWPTYAGTLKAHPAWGTQGNLSWDVAVLVLDDPLPSSVPVEDLPTPGWLDDLKSAGTLRDDPLTLVGYGNTQRLPGNLFVGSGERRATTQVVTGMTQQWLRHQQGADGGASCTNDSGAPLFLGQQLVAVLSQGDAACAGTSASVRLDVPEVRDWLVAQAAAAT